MSSCRECVVDPRHAMSETLRVYDSFLFARNVLCSPTKGPNLRMMSHARTIFTKPREHCRCARYAATMLRDRDEVRWRLQCRSNVETQIGHDTLASEKLKCTVACSGAVFRYLVCLHLYWLPSLQSF